MSTTQPNVYVATFERTVRHLAQQGITRLRPWVQERAEQSAAHNWETLDAVDAVQKTTRDADTPINDTPWGRRQTQPETWHVGDTTEQEDIVQMLVDPNSNIAVAQGKAMRRSHDDSIIFAATEDSRAGDGSAIAFPPTQTLGSVGTPIAFTYDLVTEVSEKFMRNDVDPDEEKVFVIDPFQARQLLQMTEATSGDYNALRPLTAKGYVESWMGYSWVVSTRLRSAGTGKWLFAMTRKALGLQMNRDIWVRVAEDATKSFMWRIYCASTFGTIRVEDKQIVRIAAVSA